MLAVSGMFALVSACVQDGQWFTPAGLPLGEIECTSPAPLNGAAGREVCLARVIDKTPAEIARCTRDGGRTQPVSNVDRRFACNYRKIVTGDPGVPREMTQ